VRELAVEELRRGASPAQLAALTGDGAEAFRRLREEHGIAVDPRYESRAELARARKAAAPKPPPAARTQGRADKPGRPAPPDARTVRSATDLPPRVSRLSPSAARDLAVTARENADSHQAAILQSAAQAPGDGNYWTVATALSLGILRDSDLVD
jgi:hypothetical protein